jgi:hypothetical protein
MTDIDIDKLENMALLARSGFDWQDRVEMYKRELFRACPALIAEVRRLRAIEAAAREYYDTTRFGTFLASHDGWIKLEAALAAKENKK